MSGLIDCEKSEKGLSVEKLKDEEAQLVKIDNLSINQGSSFATWRREVVTSVTTFANRITEQGLSLDWIRHGCKTTEPVYYGGYSLRLLPSSKKGEILSSQKTTQVAGMLSRRKVKAVRRGLMMSEWDLQRKTTSGVPGLNSRDFLLALTRAFESMPSPTMHLLEGFSSYGDGASSLVATAAFCQILEELPGGHDILGRCKAKKDDYDAQIIHYRELQKIVEQETDLIFMPEIQDGLLHTFESQMVRVDSWLGGDMPVFVPCHTFLLILRYCIGFSYGELMMGAHIHLWHADWAAVMEISFPVPINLDTPVSQAIQTISAGLRQSQFSFQALGIWRIRIEKLAIAVIGGCVLAALLLMGSVSSTWVILVAAAGADLRPIPGHNPAISSFPFSRRIRMESHSNTSQGAKTNLKRISHFASVRQVICENAVLQSVFCILSIPITAGITGTALVFYYVSGGIPMGSGLVNISYMDWLVFSLNFGSAMIICVCATKKRPSQVLHGIILMVLATLNLGSKAIWFEAGSLAVTNTTLMPSIWIWLSSVFISYLCVYKIQTQDNSSFCWLWPCVWGYELGRIALGILAALGRLMISKDLAPDL